jgi:hypothetical protein
MVDVPSTDELHGEQPTVSMQVENEADTDALVES